MEEQLNAIRLSIRSLEDLQSVVNTLFRGYVAVCEPDPYSSVQIKLMCNVDDNDDIVTYDGDYLNAE